MKTILSVLLSLFLLSSIQGQKVQQDSIFTQKDLEKIMALEDSIDVLSNHLLHDTSATNRFIACKFMIRKLVEALKVDNSFQYSFPELKRLSIQYPEDSSFRIFTWQLFVSDDDYRYYGAIQINAKELQLIPLSDRSYQVLNPENTVTNHDEWYGALYYNIKQVDSKAYGRYYLLFGFDSYSFFNKRKVVDVLQIQGGKAKFGAPVFKIPPDVLEEKKKMEAFNSTLPGNQRFSSDRPFVPQGETKTVSRFIMTYSADVSTRLNYDETYKLILFDNLIQIAGTHKGQGMTYVPDGSYRGFQLQPDGTWLQIEKVFNDFQQEAPRPVPLNRKDNLIPKKNN